MTNIFHATERNLLIRLAALVTGLLFTVVLFAQQGEPALLNSKPHSEDVYMASATVQVLTPVQGDVVVAGGSVSVLNSVAEDVLAAGGTVNIMASVGDDIRAAGGSVAILGHVGGDVVAAGGTVIIDAASIVEGRAWLAGGTVTVAGNVNQELKVSGRQIILAGTINGDVEVYAESVEIKPSTVIKGSLTYSAPGEADIHHDATIEGEISHKKIVLEDFEESGTGLFASLMFYISLAVSAIALFLLLPHRTMLVVKQLQDSPVKSAGLGLALLTSTPIIALMLLVSVVGVPIALVALALYAVVLIVGLLIAVIWVGELVSRKLEKQTDASKRARVWSIVTGAVSLFIIDLIPLVGGLVFFVVLVLGVGGVMQFFYQLYAQRGDRVAAVVEAGG